MNTTETTVVPADVLADLEYAVRLATTGQRDEAFEERVRDEAEKLTQAIMARHGVLDVAVELIRQGREEG